MTLTERLSTGSKHCIFLTIIPCSIPRVVVVRGLLLRNASEGAPLFCLPSILSLKLTVSYSMLCDVQDRLGSQGGPGGSVEIRDHPFFHGVDWNGLRSIRAPFEPRLNSATDVSYFPVEDINQNDDSAIVRAQAESLDDQQSADMALPFIGYTFKRFKGMNEI